MCWVVNLDMTHFYPLLSVAFLASILSGCSSSMHPYGTGSGMQPFEVPRTSTVRVVHPDPSNSLQIFVEGVMDNLGFTVLSNGQLLTPVPLAGNLVQSTDSTVLAARDAVVVQQLFEDQAADYLLKYAYTGYGPGVSNFTASLVDAGSGEIVWNYGVTFTLGRQNPRVMREFEATFRRVLHMN